MSRKLSESNMVAYNFSQQPPPLTNITSGNSLALQGVPLPTPLVKSYMYDVDKAPTKPCLVAIVVHESPPSH